MCESFWETAALSGSTSWPQVTKSKDQNMTQMYKKGHLLASFTSSTLDTKDTAKEYDFEWYHDVSDLLQGEAYMQLGVKWQTNFKKKSDVCCGEVVMTRRDMFFVPNKRV